MQRGGTPTCRRGGLKSAFSSVRRRRSTSTTCSRSHGDESKLEPQRLLGRVTRALHAKTVLTRARIKAALDPLINPAASSSDLEDADLADAVELVKLTPAALTLEELSKLWSIFFQTPYLLSVAYEGTVVLIEDDEDVPEPGLPVARRNVAVVPFGRPVIESVEAATGAADPIVIATTLRVRGRGLRGEVTRIRIGGSLVEPQSVEESELLVPLVQVPVAERCAGVQGIQVVHDVLLGHSGIASSRLRVERPRVRPPPDADVGGRDRPAAARRWGSSRQ